MENRKRFEAIDDDKEDDDEQETKKKRELAKILALLATRPEPVEKKQDTSFVDQLIAQQMAMQNENTEDDKRLEDLDDEEVEQIAHKYIDQQLEAAQVRFENSTPDSAESEKAQEDIDLLHKMKNTLNGVEESVPDESEDVSGNSLEDMTLGEVHNSPVEEELYDEEPRDTKHAATETNNTQPEKTVERDDPLPNVSNVPTKQQDSPTPNTPFTIPMPNKPEIKPPVREDSQELSPAPIISDHSQPEAGRVNSLNSHEESVGEITPIATDHAASERPNVTRPISTEQANHSVEHLSSKVDEIYKQSVSTTPERPIERIAHKPEQKSSSTNPIEEWNYDKLLQEAQKVKVNSQNLKEIAQSNKLGEGAIRRLLIDHSQGKDLKKSLSKEFLRKRISFDKLPGAKSNKGIGTAIPSGGAMTNSGSSLPPRQDPVRTPASDPLEALLKAQSSNNSKKKDHKSAHLVINILFILMIIIFLGVYIILKKRN